MLTPELRAQRRVACLSVQLLILFSGELHVPGFVSDGEPSVCYCDICKSPTSFASIKKKIGDDDWDMCLKCATSLTEKMNQLAINDPQFEPVGPLSTVTKAAVLMGVHVSKVRQVGNAQVELEEGMMANGIVNHHQLLEIVSRFSDTMQQIHSTGDVPEDMAAAVVLGETNTGPSEADAASPEVDIDVDAETAA